MVGHHHQAIDPGWQLLEHQEAGFQNLVLHRQLQQGFSAFQQDCDCRFDPGEATDTLILDFWDMTLALFRGSIVDDLISRSVADHLDRSYFNDPGEVSAVLERIGLFRSLLDPYRDKLGANDETTPLDSSPSRSQHSNWQWAARRTRTAEG